MMDYNAGATKYRFWFVETKETAKLLNDQSWNEVRDIVVQKNIYQQKSKQRVVSEFGCIKRRLENIPEDLRKLLLSADINTGKLIVFISCMSSDCLLFDLMFEVFRKKVFLGEDNITDADLNVFFKDKQGQNEKVAEFSEASVKKLKQVYCKFMFDAGLLNGTVADKKIKKPFIEQEMRSLLLNNSMGKYLAALTGEK